MENNNNDDDDAIIINETSVQHCNDSNLPLFETLEMQRLGLPTKFSSSKIKKANFRRRQKNFKYRDRIFRNQNNNFYNNNHHHHYHHEDDPLQINYEVNDYNGNDIDDNNIQQNRNDLISMEINSEIAPEHNNDSNTLETSTTMTSSEQDQLQNDIDDIVEEFPSMILSTSSFDNQENLSEDVNSIISIDDDDNSSSSSSSVSSPEDKDEETKNQSPLKRRKKQKKKKKKHRIRMNIYWRQRYILFQRFDEGIQMDDESWYSVTPEAIANHIAERAQQTFCQRYPGQKFIVMDPFCGAGGNVIQFALQPEIAKVYAIDIDPIKIKMAKHNAKIYECHEKIEFIVGDFFQITKHSYFRNLIDFCFFSPPWGGPDYIKKKKYSLHDMIPNGFEICHHTSKYLTKNLIMLLPRNFDPNELKRLSDIIYNTDPNKPAQKCRAIELEKNMIFNKIKTMTVYFGDTIQTDQDAIPKEVYYEQNK